MFLFNLNSLIMMTIRYELFVITIHYSITLLQTDFLSVTTDLFLILFVTFQNKILSQWKKILTRIKIHYKCIKYEINISSTLFRHKILASLSDLLFFQ